MTRCRVCRNPPQPVPQLIQPQRRDRPPRILNSLLREIVSLPHLNGKSSSSSRPHLTTCRPPFWISLNSSPKTLGYPKPWLWQSIQPGTAARTRRPSNSQRPPSICFTRNTRTLNGPKRPSIGTATEHEQSPNRQVLFSMIG